MLLSGELCSKHRGGDVLGRTSERPVCLEWSERGRKCLESLESLSKAR